MKSMWIKFFVCLFLFSIGFEVSSALAGQGKKFELSCDEISTSKELSKFYSEYFNQLPSAVRDNKGKLAELTSDFKDIRGAGYLSVMLALNEFIEFGFGAKKPDLLLKAFVEADYRDLRQKIASFARIYSRYLSAEGQPSRPWPVLGAKVLRAQSLRYDSSANTLVFERLTPRYILRFAIPAHLILEWIYESPMRTVGEGEIGLFETRYDRNQPTKKLPTSVELANQIGDDQWMLPRSLQEFAIASGLSSPACLIDIPYFHLQAK